MRIILENAARKTVVEFDIPNLTPFPKIVVWMGRTFVFRPAGGMMMEDNQTRFVEEFSYSITQNPIFPKE